MAFPALALGQGRADRLAAGEIAYTVGGRDGSETVVLPARTGDLDVIVQLKQPPLSWYRRGLPRERAVNVSARDTQNRAALKRTLRSAADGLRLEHERVREAIASWHGSPAVSRGQDPAIEIRHEYVNAFNGLALRAPAALVERLRRHPDVLQIHDNMSVYPTLAESVPLVRAPEVWAGGATGKGIVVGIIDSGIDYTHPDLGGSLGPGHKVIGGYDFVNSDDDPMDDFGHGTHVAGIIAANGTLTGVAPEARLVAYKVFDRHGAMASRIVAAIERAADPDGDPATDDALDVINLSVGGSGTPDDPMSQAVDNVVAAGIVAVVSAGNNGDRGFGTVHSPSGARQALTVGASDKSDRFWRFSSRGPAPVTYGVKPEVVAPGESIESTVLSGGHEQKTGTSMAAPHVAGAAALLLQARPGLTPAGVKSLLMTTARDLGENLFAQGAGRIDVAAALSRTLLASPAAVSFGLDDGTQETFAGSATLTVTNDSEKPRRCSLRVDTAGLPAGVDVSVTPSTLNLDAGATGTVTLDVRVDNAVVPGLDEPPHAYVGRVRLDTREEALQVPFAFLRPALVAPAFRSAASAGSRGRFGGASLAAPPAGSRGVLLAAARHLRGRHRLQERHRRADDPDLHRAPEWNLPDDAGNGRDQQRRGHARDPHEPARRERLTGGPELHGRPSA